MLLYAAGLRDGQGPQRLHHADPPGETPGSAGLPFGRHSFLWDTQSVTTQSVQLRSAHVTDVDEFA